MQRRLVFARAVGSTAGVAGTSSSSNKVKPNIKLIGHVAVRISDAQEDEEREEQKYIKAIATRFSGEGKGEEEEELSDQMAMLSAEEEGEEEGGEGEGEGEEDENWPRMSSKDAEEYIELFDQEAMRTIKEKEEKVYRTNPQAPDRHMTKARGRWFQKRAAQKRTWFKWQREAKVLSYSPRTEGFLLSSEEDEVRDYISRRDTLIGRQ